MLEWLLIYEDGTTEIIRTYSVRKAHEIARERNARLECIGYR